MKNKITLAVLLLGLIAGSNNLFSQNPSLTWAYGLSVAPTNGQLLISSLFTDAYGNTYVLADIKGTVDFDLGAGVTNISSLPGKVSVVVAKYNAAGNLLWVRVINLNDSSPMPSKFAVDASGNVIITGTFSATIDLNPNAGTANVTSVGQDDIFVAKWTTNGDYVWGFRIGNAAYDSHACVAVDPNGNIFLSGQMVNTIIDLDPSAAVANITGISGSAYIAKYSSTGAYIWGGNIGVLGAKYMTTNAAGDVFLTGEFVGTVDLDPSAGTANLVSAGSRDVYMAKYNASGNYAWAKSLSGTSWDYASSIALDAQENVLLAFVFEGTVDLDPSAGVADVTAASFGSSDGAFAKYDPSGNYLWGGSIGAGTLSTEYISDICADAASNVYISGKYSGTVDFDITSGVLNRTAAGYNSYLAKYTSSGNVLWVNEFEYCDATSLTVNGPGTEIIFAGDHLGSVDLDYTAGVYEVTGTGSNSAFLAKYAGANCTSTVSSISITDCSSYTVPSGHETYTVSGTYTDTIPNAANCDSVITINLTINDLIAPVANTATLANVTNQCSVTSLTAPTATDNCAGTITGTHSTTLPITTQGTTIVTWTYADGNGNTSTQTQNVIINDNTAPVVNTANLSTVTGQCSVTSLTAPTAMDNCAGTITGTHNATLPITTQGTTVVTWTYTDGNGNTSTQTQNVIIADNTAPVASTANLADVTGQCSVTSLTAPTATDNCAGTITGTHNATLPITTQGTTVIIWTYADGNGNTSTQTQNVIVTLPVATTTLSGITISATTSGATYQWINCGTGNTPITGATSQSFTATANGSYAVIVTQNGCSSTSACVAISTVGLDEMAQTLFTVYPNPNNGTFVVTTELPTTITITNSAGQLIATHPLKSGENTIELSHVESGVYFISAMNSNGQVSVQRISVF